LWEADASDWGADIIGYRYAYDDTTVWSEWDLESTEFPPDGGTFVPTLGHHTLYVQAKDDQWTVGLCRFQFYVATGPATPPSDPILLVDDSQFSGLPNSVGDWQAHLADDVEAEFFGRILAGYDYDEWDCLAQGREPPPVDLVGQYRNVVWYVDDYDEMGSQLWELFHWGTRYLDSYVRVGGNLILIGQRPAESLDPDCRGYHTYPFRYDPLYCYGCQPIPISYTAFGLKDLFCAGDEVFAGGISLLPGNYPDLPLGDTWPFFTETDSIYLWDVEAFDPDGINPEINAIPTYDFNYAPGTPPEQMAGEHCALMVDNSADPTTGSTAYFGWCLIWCDWDSVAAFMETFLTDVCDEPPSGP
jgi:hypothetical protein